METRSTCPYCGTGCGVIVEHDGQRIHGVRGAPDHPANFGRLCIKGSTLHLTAAPETLALRALVPELRESKEAPRQPADWQAALDLAAGRFAAAIRDHGPDSVAFYISGQLLTEDYYVFNKLVKGLIGTNNLDTNSRLCMSSAVAGYKLSLGADAPPCSYEDIAHTSTGIVILYSPKMTLRGNSLAHVAGGGGACITFKESGEALVEDNTLLHCAVGFQANAPLEESAVITLKGNRFSHNTTAIYFYGEKGGHRILDNRFEHNLTQVAVSAVSVGGDNVWSGNHWSDYQGFDRNDDGIGDSPHEVFVFADRIWMEEPITTFFRNSPAFELLDFLERLAPFAAPAKILSDPRPRFR